MIPVRKQDALAFLKLDNGTFELLETAHPIPLEGPWGAIDWQYGLAVDTTAQSAWKQGRDAQGRLYLLSIGYGESPAAVQVFYSEPFEDLPYKAEALALPGGQVLLAGGVRADSYDAQGTVLLCYTQGKPRSASYWLGLAVGSLFALLLCLLGWYLSRRKASASFQPEASDWIIYIPFDPCDFRLGGSTLAQAVGANPSTPADVADADYFMDCYEVLRELVEDGIVKAGVTVGDGGLMTALRAMTSAGTGADVSIREIAKSYGENLPVRILFSEVPGVLIQIADIDYDYVDAELILQDVVYFPIGHPVPGHPEVKLTSRIEIPQILESLLNTLEGED